MASVALDGLPPVVRATLTIGDADPDVLRPRSWAYSSLRLNGYFEDADTGQRVDVSDVAFAFGPEGARQSIVPRNFAIRIGIGHWACAILPARSGVWWASVRSLRPVCESSARSFLISALPAGMPPPPLKVVTDPTKRFIYLSPSGAMITP